MATHGMLPWYIVFDIRADKLERDDESENWVCSVTMVAIGFKPFMPTSTFLYIFFVVPSEFLI